MSIQGHRNNMNCKRFNSITCIWNKVYRYIRKRYNVNTLFTESMGALMKITEYFETFNFLTGNINPSKFLDVGVCVPRCTVDSFFFICTVLYLDWNFLNVLNWCLLYHLCCHETRNSPPPPLTCHTCFCSTQNRHFQTIMYKIKTRKRLCKRIKRGKIKSNR